MKGQTQHQHREALSATPKSQGSGIAFYFFWKQKITSQMMNRKIEKPAIQSKCRAASR